MLCYVMVMKCFGLLVPTEVCFPLMGMKKKYLDYQTFLFEWMEQGAVPEDADRSWDHPMTVLTGMQCQGRYCGAWPWS